MEIKYNGQLSKQKEAVCVHLDSKKECSRYLKREEILQAILIDTE